MPIVVNACLYPTHLLVVCLLGLQLGDPGVELGRAGFNS